MIKMRRLPTDEWASKVIAKRRTIPPQWKVEPLRFYRISEPLPYLSGNELSND